MNRFKSSLPVIGLVALVAALISGCGAGQISQMSTEEPAVNGNRVTINSVALRDIRMQAEQTSDFLQPGRTVNLVAVAVNQSPNVEDRLVGVTSDVGTVTINGDARLPAGGMLYIGTPDGQNVAPGPLGPTVKATVTLAKPISNGLNYNFTFTFEKAGQASVTVPISAGLGNQPA